LCQAFDNAAHGRCFTAVQKNATWIILAHRSVGKLDGVRSLLGGSLSRLVRVAKPELFSYIHLFSYFISCGFRSRWRRGQITEDFSFRVNFPTLVRWKRASSCPCVAPQCLNGIVLSILTRVKQRFSLHQCYVQKCTREVLVQICRTNLLHPTC